MPLHQIRPLPDTWTRGPEWQIISPDGDTLAYSASLAGIHQFMQHRRIHVAKLTIKNRDFVLIPQHFDETSLQAAIAKAETETFDRDDDNHNYPMDEQEHTS